MQKTCRILFLVALGCVCRAEAQAVPPKLETGNEIELSQTSIHFRAHEDYLGAGIAYRRMIRPWFGLEAEASDYPQMQSQGDDKSYGELIQFVGAVLFGHRWRSVSLFGEGGMGAMRSHVFAGLNSQLQGTKALRTYKDVIVGGLLDVKVAKRWSLTFEARDNIDFIGTFYEYNVTNPSVRLVDPATVLHSGEVRMGVAVRF